MGYRLAEVFVRNLNGEFSEDALELNEGFVATLKSEVILEGEVLDVVEDR